jgi:hypothetical protein
MSYLHSYQFPNGDYLETFHVYKCDVTGEEIDCSHPHFFFEPDVHISYNGLYKLVEDTLLHGFHAGIMPYVLEELIDRYYKRKKFNRYIRPELKKKVLAKYEHTCVKCGSKDNLTIDHIIPVVEGGKNEFPNLQVLCKPCNSSKGKKDNAAFMSTTKSNPQ